MAEDKNKTKQKNQEKIQEKSQTSEKPFFKITYNRGENFLENFKSILCIYLLSLPFTGIFLLTFVLLYCNIYLKTFFIAIVISQFFFEGRIDTWYNFIKYLQVQKYFKSFTIISEDEVHKENTILPFSPHGIVANACSSAVCSGWEPLDNFKVLASRLVIYIPLSGFFARLLGIQGVDSKNFLGNMKNRRNILFIPGGYECATYTNDNYDQVFIKERKGFIKYALMFGYRVHPVYSFGENRLYYMIKNYYLRKIGLFLNKFKLPGVFFFGRYLIFPRIDIDVCACIGKAIQFPKIENPSQDDIDSYHKLYVQKLKELFDRYKNQYGASEELVIN